MVTAIIERYKEPQSDGMGGTIGGGWEPHLTVEGYLDKLQGDEVLASERLGETSSHVFITFDVVDDITRSDRMIIDGKVLDIKDVDNPMQMNKHLEIRVLYQS